MSDNIEKKKVEQPEVTSQAVSANNINEVELLKKQMEEQKSQIALLLQLIQQSNQSKPVEASTNPYGNMIKIVHLVQRAPGLTTYIALSNLEITMTDFGEERNLTVQQFEEMIGKYRGWFNAGMISVAAGYEKMAEHYGLKTAKDYPINSDFIKNLGKMSMSDLEDIYPRLPESGKDFIVSYWIRKTIEKNADFRNVYKLETLNRLSEGACAQILADINAENVKK